MLAIRPAGFAVDQPIDAKECPNAMRKVYGEYFREAVVI